MHIKEFMLGYRSSAEAVQVRFPRVDQTRSIQDFATGYNDGQLKCITMIGLVVIIHALDPWFENFWEQNWFTLDMLFVLFSSIMFFPFSKSLLLGLLLGTTKELEDHELDNKAVDHMLQSFRFIRCCYEHFEVPSHHYLHALRALVALMEQYGPF